MVKDILTVKLEDNWFARLIDILVLGTWKDFVKRRFHTALKVVSTLQTSHNTFNSFFGHVLDFFFVRACNRQCSQKTGRALESQKCFYAIHCINHSEKVDFFRLQRLSLHFSSGCFHNGSGGLSLISDELTFS